MPSTMRYGKPRIVVVSDRTDASVEGLVSRLREAGALVDIQSDVYTMMAMLAKGAVLDDVLVDVRSLDRRELGFLRLAPRYHAAVNFVVPILEGTEERLEAAGGWLQGVRVEAMVGAVVQRISGALAPVVADSSESEIAADVQEALPVVPGIPTELIQDEHDLATGESQFEMSSDAASVEQELSSAFREAATDEPVEVSLPKTIGGEAEVLSDAEPYANDQAIGFETETVQVETELLPVEDAFGVSEQATDEAVSFIDEAKAVEPDAVEADAVEPDVASEMPIDAEEAVQQESFFEALPVEEEVPFAADEYVPVDFPNGDVPLEAGSAFPADETEPSEIAMDTPALSTDGGPENAPEGPSLHEAVRMRMAENGSGAVRRRKPPGFASPTEPTAEDAESDLSGTDSAYGDDSTISPEEMDALLTDEETEGRPPLDDDVNRDDVNQDDANRDDVNRDDTNLDGTSREEGSV